MLRYALPLLVLCAAALRVHRADAPLRRESRSIEFHLVAPPGVAFPVFGPTLEAKWADSWSPNFAWPADGSQRAEGAVFTVQHNGREGIWVMSRYDTGAHVVDYVVATPGFTTAQIHIEVLPDPDGDSRATVSYTVTALSPAGNDYIDHWATAFPTQGPHWAAAINKYLVYMRARQ